MVIKANIQLLLFGLVKMNTSLGGREGLGFISGFCEGIFELARSAFPKCSDPALNLLSRGWVI